METQGMEHQETSDDGRPHRFVRGDDGENFWVYEETPFGLVLRIAKTPIRKPSRETRGEIATTLTPKEGEQDAKLRTCNLVGAT
jgi:hypothetical protein